jgi:FkbM family methyltransferase
MPNIQSLIRGIAHQILHRTYNFALGKRVINGISRWLDKRTITVTVRTSELVFLAGLGHSTRRASGMEHKEPETLDWIDSFRENPVFWDVGASTGIYAIYAAVSKQLDVVAIEPSPYNVPVIATNLKLNKVERLVTLLPCALNSKTKVCRFALVSSEVGESQHQVLTTDVHPNWSRHVYQVPSFSIDFLVQSCGLPSPQYIKIDVDGIEHLILQGGLTTLKSVRGILVETPTDRLAQAQTCEQLVNAGLVQIEHSRANTVWARL